MRTAAWRRGVTVGLWLTAASCATGGTPGAPKPAEVRVDGLRLVEAPPAPVLAAYLCPRALRAEGHVGTAADALCQQIHGQVPPSDAARLVVDVSLRVRNPDRAPLPLGSVVFRLTPQRPADLTGAAAPEVCVLLPGAPAAACGPPDPSGMLVALALAEGAPRSLPPRGSAVVVARLSVAAEALWPSGLPAGATHGETLRGALPFAIEGHVNARAAERVAAAQPSAAPGRRVPSGAHTF